MAGYPIDRAVYRALDPEFAGVVVTADIDRTYLATRFSSRRSMMRIPFERAVHKRDIEGMARLLRELRRGPGLRTRETPLFFLSASPKQLRPVIERKMGLDGISFDGSTFKDWLAVFRGGHPRRIREQVGFKLTALLTARANLPRGACEVLLGDDLETDPVAYGLYAKIVAGKVRRAALGLTLREHGVRLSDIAHIEELIERVGETSGVLRAFIRLERHRDTDAFLRYAPGVVGCRGAFQMAACMWRLGLVSVAAVGRVAASLSTRGVDAQAISICLHDLRRRAMLDEDEVAPVLDTLHEHGIPLPRDELPPADPRWVEAWTGQ